MELSGDAGVRLRAVFDICDPDKKGFITVDHFVNLAREHFGAGDEEQDNEVMCRIIEVLDPEGDGKIHFSEFCQGVKQILELKSPCSPPVTVSSPYLFPVSRPQTLNTDCSVTAPEEDTNSSGTHDTSELSTFNEYDMMTDDDQTPMAIHTDNAMFLGDMNPSQAVISSEDDHDSAFSGKSSDTQDLHPVMDDSSITKVYYVDGVTERDIDSGSRASSTQKSTEKRTHRRVTSNGLASQLFRSNTERRGSYGSDEIFDDIDGNFIELNDKVKKLEAQIQLLTESQQKTDQRHLKLKEENCSLVERVHLLEEQLRDVEQKSNMKLAEEERKYREMMMRIEKEKAMEIDILAQSLKHIEEEYQALKEEAPRLRVENERFKKQNHRLEQQLQDAHHQLSALSEEHMELQRRHHEVNADYEQERTVSAQLIEELSRELDELRTKMEDNDMVLSCHTSGHDLSRTQKRQLELTIARLKEENTHLRDEKEELMLGNHIQEGRSLVQNGMSLAEEIENLPKDELLRTVRELQHENDTLRQYIDRMTLRIIEKNPSILEIPIHKSAKKK
ncbi:hypothetical protein LSH36_6g14018 [Paralvinella palmiformis]|uniref:Rab11 family-interacting protein 3 n=1 Tax=Paralvinella palmiformis TaxID=53620 RepID=A0AAD9KF30_9ANNE|nr:hypothetical protein LSH36_6g14018 [Paralvinella palmiformis]